MRCNVIKTHDTNTWNTNEVDCLDLSSSILLCVCNGLKEKLQMQPNGIVNKIEGKKHSDREAEYDTERKHFKRLATLCKQRC